MVQGNHNVKSHAKTFLPVDTADHPSSRGIPVSRAIHQLTTAAPHHTAASPPRPAPKGATVAMRDGTNASLVPSFGPSFPTELPLRGELFVNSARRLDTVAFKAGPAVVTDIGAAKANAFGVGLLLGSG